MTKGRDVPVAEEILWEFYRPRDLGNRQMGASPVTHIVMHGQHVPEGHMWRTVDTRKGRVPEAPAYQPRAKKRGIQPRQRTYDRPTEIDWAEVSELLL